MSKEITKGTVDNIAYAIASANDIVDDIENLSEILIQLASNEEVIDTLRTDQFLTLGRTLLYNSDNLKNYIVVLEDIFADHYPELEW